MGCVEEIWQRFVHADDMIEVMETFRQLCDVTEASSRDSRGTYNTIKHAVEAVDKNSLKLWSALDKRAAHNEYDGGDACRKCRVLVVGAGPCGLRTALEMALLGAVTDVVEVRPYISRVNVLHLWVWVQHDLGQLGIKFFYPRFCLGELHHISICMLQMCLLKMCLLLGVNVHCPVAFKSLIQSDSNTGAGWRVCVEPEDQLVSQNDYDVIIGADGRRNCLDFDRKPRSCKLAIAVTANFVNKRKTQDVRIKELGGLACYTNTELSQELTQRTGVFCENYAYFKDETHYMVMTPQKKGLIETGILKQDYPGDVKTLLAKENVDQDKLQQFSKTMFVAVNKGELPDPQFATNRHGDNDVAIFDFSTMYLCTHSCRVMEKEGKRLLMCVVGDTLMEPFWPQGTGAGRGFLSSLDAAWMVRTWCREDHKDVDGVLDVIAERESLFKQLPSSAPRILKDTYTKYTIDPATRYRSTRTCVQPQQVRHLYHTDCDDEGLVLEQ